MPSVISTAPIRIADAGGWTDTWFAGHGAVCNLAVTPMVEVRVDAFDTPDAESTVEFYVKNYGMRYGYVSGTAPGINPLLEATVDFSGIREGMSLRITIDSLAPPGASTGTSAAVTVALLAGLDSIAGRQRTAYETAMTAHHAEMQIAGMQCGVQDQLASACGGINFIEIEEFPRARVTPLDLPQRVRWELERRLLLVYLGASHSSSDLHLKVIQELEGEGPDSARLQRLRACAVRARDSLLAGDFKAYGRALTENTEAQAALHRDLVSADALKIIDLARNQDAAGWKINGAGGEGGSLTILCGDKAEGQRCLIEGLADAVPKAEIIPVRLSMEGVKAEEEFDV